MIAFSAAVIGLVADDFFAVVAWPFAAHAGDELSGIVLGGLAASLLIIAPTLPLLEGTTPPESVRAE